jgi:N-acetyl-anhydromuramyl-L-alanine amidase AmpD
MLMLNILSKPQPEGDYYKEVTQKTALVLHFTAGYTAESARSTLDKVDHIAVHYIVDTNGDVWHKFDRQYWGFHLGMKCCSPDRFQDKRTISIEIVNIGPVWLKNGKYHDYVGKVWSENTVFKAPGYRSTDGCVKFPEAQTEAVCELVDVILGKEPHIPRKIPKDKLAYQLPALEKFNGVLTHGMYRKDKYDLGPAFNYKRLIEVCKLQEV